MTQPKEIPAVSLIPKQIVKEEIVCKIDEVKEMVACNLRWKTRLLFVTDKHTPFGILMRLFVFSLFVSAASTPLRSATFQTSQAAPKRSIAHYSVTLIVTANSLDESVYKLDALHDKLVSTEIANGRFIDHNCSFGDRHNCSFGDRHKCSAFAISQCTHSKDFSMLSPTIVHSSSVMVRKFPKIAR